MKNNEGPKLYKSKKVQLTAITKTKQSQFTENNHRCPHRITMTPLPHALAFFSRWTGTK